MSHPMRVRGLKSQTAGYVQYPIQSHPMRVRGLKSNGSYPPERPWGVAPHAGAWIEIRANGYPKGDVTASHPMRVRGLK